LLAWFRFGGRRSETYDLFVVDHWDAFVPFRFFFCQFEMSDNPALSSTSHDMQTQSDSASDNEVLGVFTLEIH